MLAEGGFFADGFYQGQVNARAVQLERNTRKACSRADVDDFVILQGGESLQAGERIQKVLDADAFTLANGGEVKLLVLGKQLVFKKLESFLLLHIEGKTIGFQQGGKFRIHAGIIPTAFLKNAKIP